MTSARRAAIPLVLILGLSSAIGERRAASDVPRAGAEEAFGRRVEAAIDEASRALHDEVRQHGWLRFGKYSGDYPMGSLGLTLTALLRSGMPPGDRVIAEGLQILMHLPLEPGSVPDPGIPGWPPPEWKPRCYDLALGLLALEAPAITRRAVAQGDHYLVRYRRGSVPPDVRARMAELTKRLIAMMQDGAWSYTRSERPDNSNTQFAVLALHAAQRSGVEVPVGVWKAVLRRLLRDQHRDGPEIELRVEYARSGARRGDGRAARRGGRAGSGGPRRSGSGVEERTVAARPWGYYMGGGDVRYPMVCACLSDLVIARDALRSLNALDANLIPRIEESLFGGLAYVAANWQKYSAGNAAGDFQCLQYDLYTFEKFGEIEGVATVNGHDWYREGAERLLETRRPKGAWQFPFGSALALLFLNRATLDPAVRVLEIGAIYTGKESGGDDDLVFIEFLGGVVSGREALTICAEMQSRHNLRCAREVLERYPSHRMPRLIPALLLLHEARGKARRLARGPIRVLTGLRSPKASEIKELRELHERWLRIWEVETGSVEDGTEATAQVRKELKRAQGVSPWIAEAALRAVETRHLTDLAAEVLAFFDHPLEALRVRARGTLWGLTGIDLPFDAAAAEAERAEQIEAWRRALEGWRRSSQGERP
ncbi:MAG: hypothetical protein ACE5GW_08760 [Planctomycetota bacterium]